MSEAYQQAQAAAAKQALIDANAGYVDASTRQTIVSPVVVVPTATPTPTPTMPSTTTVKRSTTTASGREIDYTPAPAAPAPTLETLNTGYIDASVRQEIASPSTPISVVEQSPIVLPLGPASPSEAYASGVSMNSPLTQAQQKLTLVDIAIKEQNDVIGVAEGQLTVAKEILANASDYDFSTYSGGKTQYVKDVATLETQLQAAQRNLTTLSGIQTTLLIQTSGVESVLHKGEKYVVTYVDDKGESRTKSFDSKYDAQQWAEKYDIGHRKYEVSYQSEGGKEVKVSFSDPDSAQRFTEMLTEVNVAQMQATSKLLSGSLWEQSTYYKEGDVEKLFGVIPYSPKGAFEIKAILAGSLENTISPILNLIPGRQPYEVLPEEINVSWKNLEKMGLSADKLFVGQSTGAAAEALGAYVASLGVGAVIGTGVGVAGAAISRLPMIGDKAYKVGSIVSNIFSTPLGKAGLIVGLGVPEVSKLYTLSQSGASTSKVLMQGAIDVSGFLGGVKGFTSGLDFGKSSPQWIRYIAKGGKIIPRGTIEPAYMLSGEAKFPDLGREGLQPTTEGYAKMADKYLGTLTEGMGEGVPGIHAGLPLRGKNVMIPPEPDPYTYYAPAGSEKFLSKGGVGIPNAGAVSEVPLGIPNPFGRPEWTLYQAPGVEVTTLGKNSQELIDLVNKTGLKTGFQYMPLEQLSGNTGGVAEAQAVVARGLPIRDVAGNYWEYRGGGTLVPIRRIIFNPEGATTLDDALRGAVAPTESEYKSVSFLVSPVTGYGSTLAPSSVSLNTSSVSSLVKVINSDILSKPQLSSALSVLKPASLAAVLKSSLPSIRSKIVSSLSSTGNGSSVAEALSTLPKSTQSEVVNSLSPSASESIIQYVFPSSLTPSETKSTMPTSSTPSTSKSTPSPPNSTPSETKSTPSQKPSSPSTISPTTHMKAVILKPPMITNRKQEETTYGRTFTFKVRFSGRGDEVKVVEAQSFPGALAKAYASRRGSGVPREVEVIRLGERRV